MQALARGIDRLNSFIGKAASWLVLILVLITLFDVAMRYGFRAGTIWIQEAEWHLYAAGFMLAAAYTLRQDNHARVDVLFYSRVGARGRAAINLFGSIVFLIPFSILVIWASMPFVTQSWELMEGSPDPGGLPGLYLMKSLIPLAFGLLALQGVSEIIKSVTVLRTGEAQPAK